MQPRITFLNNGKITFAMFEYRSALRYVFLSLSLFCLQLTALGSCLAGRRDRKGNVTKDKCEGYHYLTPQGIPSQANLLPVLITSSRASDTL